jgi:hypothetical protein
MESFDLMLCQVFARWQGGIRRPALVERRATVRISVVGVTGTRCGIVIDFGCICLAPPCLPGGCVPQG